MTDRSMVWRRLDKPGHEFCTLAKTDGGAKLTGVAVLTNDRGPCVVQYKVDCDSHWRTLICHVTGYVGKHPINLDIRREGVQWLMNGVEVPEVTGAEDIDLGFSPSTNLFPIQRLALTVGQKATVRAAWLRFPELTLELLEQTYARLGPDIYHYESGGGAFKCDLKVDDVGLILDYPGIWRAESRA